MTEQNERPKNSRARWRPARRLETFEKDPKMGYRWCVDDPSNIERKQFEGWSFVNNTTGARADPEMDDNSSSGAKKHNELVLMAAPNEVLGERDDYHQNLNDRAAEAVVRSTKQRAKDMGGEIDGKLIIE